MSNVPFQKKCQSHKKSFDLKNTEKHNALRKNLVPTVAIFKSNISEKSF